MHSKLVIVVALLAALLAVPPGLASATPTSRGDRLVDAATALGLTCQELDAYTRDEQDGWVMTCTGELTTFDGLTLDTVLTLPVGRRFVDGGEVALSHDARVPVVLFQPGWGGGAINIRNTELTRWAAVWHWNNWWWALKGYATLSFTPRGFHESCGVRDDDAGCTNGHTRLAAKDFEVRDAQHLLGTLVDAGIADRERLAATGGSYGGGQSWMLATSMPWKTPAGKTVQLAAAVPFTTWTDLHDALLPNGRANTTGRPPAEDEPVGVLKQGWVSGFWAVGRAVGARYSNEAGDWGANFDAILATWQQGEPYGDAAERIRDAWKSKSARYNTEFLRAVRSGDVRAVPILAVNGWTDSVFPAHQSVQMYHALRAARSDYPVSLVFADVGHGAGERLEHYQAISEVTNRFLDAALATTPVAREVRSLRTSCGAQSSTWTIAGSWEALTSTTFALTSNEPAVTASAPQPTNTLSNHYGAPPPCASEPPAVGAARWRWTMQADTTVLGPPVLSAQYSLSGSDATVAAKVWDVAPDGTRTLVTRGVYRLSAPQHDPVSGDLTFELFGNHWTFPAGHQLELELSQTDAPFLRPSNHASSIHWSNVTLTLPTSPPLT